MCVFYLFVWAGLKLGLLPVIWICLFEHVLTFIGRDNSFI